ncbi:MAG: hypothetical protein O7E52_20530 [Candidatus Poribacteria bacterium]|nr:hypothetical protein [Candidatus Poribacteria bacterium]
MKKILVCLSATVLIYFLYLLFGVTQASQKEYYLITRFVSSSIVGVASINIPKEFDVESDADFLEKLRESNPGLDLNVVGSAIMPLSDKPQQFKIYNRYARFEFEFLQAAQKMTQTVLDVFLRIEIAGQKGYEYVENNHRIFMEEDTILYSQEEFKEQTKESYYTFLTIASIDWKAKQREFYSAGAQIQIEGPYPPFKENKQ